MIRAGPEDAIFLCERADNWRRHPAHDASRWSGCGGPAPHILRGHRLLRPAVSRVDTHAGLGAVPDGDDPRGHPYAGTHADVLPVSGKREDVVHLRADPVTGTRADVVQLAVDSGTGTRGELFTYRHGARTNTVI